MNPSRSGRLHELDYLRCFAAIAVVLFHYTFRGWAADGLSSVRFATLGGITKYGYLGVDLFFIVSGFVILMSAQGRSARAFVIARVARLYPAYWAAVLVTSSVTALFGYALLRSSPGVIVANLTMLQGFAHIPHVDGVYWSLEIELRFYFLVFCLMRGAQLVRVRVWLWAWLVVAVATHFLGHSMLVHIVAAALLSDWAAYFIAGCFFFLIRSSRVFRPLDHIGVLACWIWACVKASERATDLRDHYLTTFSSLIIFFVVSLFFVAFYILAVRGACLPATRSGALLGALTYPLYLIHQRIGYAILNSTDGRLERHVVLVALVVGMICLAWLLHTLIEKPLSRRLKQRLTGSASVSTFDHSLANVAVFPGAEVLAAPDRSKSEIDAA